MPPPRTGALCGGRRPAARATAATLTLGAYCVTAATPLLAALAAGESVWLIQTAFAPWIGTLRPEALLGDASPACAPRARAARPFLGGA